jgi:hypothetical protein
LPNEALEILIETYNNILRASVFPDDWKNTEYSLSLKETK